MASNIIDLIKSQMDDTFAGVASGVTGLDRDRTKKAVGGAIPAVLSAITSAVSGSRGKGALSSLLNSQEPGLLSSLSSTLAGGNQKSLINSGIGMLGSLLGENRFNGLVKALGASNGIGSGETRSLLGLVTPVAMGVLGRELRNSGFGFDSAASFLASQKANIQAAMPQGLASSLESSGVLDGWKDQEPEARETETYETTGTAATYRETPQPTYRERETATSTYQRPTPTHTASTIRRQPEPRGSRGAWWALAAGAAALSLVLWGVTRNRGVEEEARPVAQVDERPVERSVQPPPQQERQIAAATDANRMMVGDVDVRREFTSIIDTTAQTLRNVTDPSTGEAALPRLTAIDSQIDDLAPLVSRLPSAARPAFMDLARGDVGRLENEIRRVDSVPGLSDDVKTAVASVAEKLRDLIA